MCRGYSGKKLEDNIQCEIFGTILEEAIDSYKKDSVFELSSNNADEMDENVEQIVQWIEQWKQNKMWFLNVATLGFSDVNKTCAKLALASPNTCIVLY